MPSAEHEALVAALADNPVQAESIDEQRANYDAMLGAMPLADDVSVEPARIDGLAADWVSVDTSASDRAVLYLHGGGYVIGSNVAYREFGSRMARATGARVLVLHYRLAPENPFPAALDDATRAYQWLLEQGIAANRTLIAGDSAGGGLTLATLVNIREKGLAMPAGGVCLSPWADLAHTGDSTAEGAVDDPLMALEGLEAMASSYAGSDVSNPLVSPLYADLSGLPPLSILAGGRELLRDDARRLVEKARDAGVDVDHFEGDGLIHVWPVLAPTAPESIAALERISAFASSRFA